jgi:hypothetical protein
MNGCEPTASNSALALDILKLNVPKAAKATTIALTVTSSVTQ